MEVKPGYKQTEVGGIPEEWESSKIGDFSFVTKLAGFEYTIHFDYSKSGPVIAVRALNIKNGTLDLTEVHTIPRKTSDDLPRSKLVKGDLVISYVGTLGRVAMIPEDEKFHLAPNVAKICVDKDRVAPEFLAQFLNSFNGQKLIFDAAASTTQAALSMGNLRGIFFVRPPLPEQRAIATALSDVDGLLGGLDRLIAKKRDLKQAAMQQLLTGQTRLPGFHGEWEVNTVAELEKHKLVKLSRGQVISKKDIDNTPGEYSIYSSSIHNDGLFGRYGDFMFDEELITWSVDGGGNFFHRRKHKFSVTNVCGFMRVDTSRIDYRYFAAELQLLHSRKSFDYQSKAHPSVVRKEYEVQLPPLPEQTAIAEVLTEMDGELAVLTQRWEKTRALKQAMMQELLTGRTRLV